MTITMARGDIHLVPFTIKDATGQPSTINFDEIYATFKANYNDRKALFQKRLSDGSIIKTGTGAYQFTIIPADTDGLAFQTYVFDIEVEYEDSIKRTFPGKLVLTEEATHACNEVVE